MSSLGQFFFAITSVIDSKGNNKKKTLYINQPSLIKNEQILRGSLQNDKEF